LLYKIGRKSEAINWQRRALALAIDKHNTPNIEEFTERLDRMISNKPTWVENIR
jgi:hypothetical protein